jgi:hypothetical protein
MIKPHGTEPATMLGKREKRRTKELKKDGKKHNTIEQIKNQNTKNQEVQKIRASRIEKVPAKRIIS